MINFCCLVCLRYVLDHFRFLRYPFANVKTIFTSRFGLLFSHLLCYFNRIHWRHEVVQVTTFLYHFSCERVLFFVVICMLLQCILCTEWSVTTPPPPQTHISRLLKRLAPYSDLNPSKKSSKLSVFRGQSMLMVHLTYVTYKGDQFLYEGQKNTKLVCLQFWSRQCFAV